MSASNKVKGKLEQLDKECGELKSKMCEETPNFSALLDEVCAGKEYKLPKLVELIDSQRKLTPTQTEYLFRKYKIERMTGVDVSNSVALALLILGNKNLTRHILNKYAPHANSWDKENIEIELDDALRRAIDTYDVEYGTAFSTYAFKVCYLALTRTKPEVCIVSDSTPITDNLIVSDAIGANDDFFDDFSWEDYAKSVWRLLGYFNDKCQFIVMARLGKYCEPMSYAEIGEVMGISAGSVGYVVREVIRDIGRIEKNLPKKPKLRHSLCREQYHLMNGDEFHNRFKAECTQNASLGI